MSESPTGTERAPGAPDFHAPDFRASDLQAPDLEAQALEALFALDTPPAHDPMFVMAVTQRVLRRRLVRDLLGGVFTSAVSALLLWALGPVLAPVLKPVADTLLLFMPLLTIAAVVLWLTHPRHSPV